MRRRSLRLLVVAVALAFGPAAARAVSDDAAPGPPVEPAHVGYPSSIVGLGDSGSTGYNSGPPNRDVPANAWATGSNPEVQSHYLRILAANPRIRGRATSYARDGDRVRDLLRQARLVGSKTEYVAVDIGGNDVCGLAETSPALFRSQLRSGLTALSKAAPNARILVVGLGSAVHFFEVVATIPDARAAVSDGGPCDPLFDAEGRANPQRVAEIEAKIQAANGLLEAGCAAFVHCRYDGNSTAGLPTEPADLSRDWGHASVRGLARKAEVTWKATFDFTDAVAPVSRLVRAGRVCTLSATDDRGVAGTEYRLGKRGWIRYSKPVSVAKGTVFTWRSVDVNGNTERSRSVAF